MKDSTKLAIQRWVAWGIEPGGFVLAVLENNLIEALGRADSENLRDIHEIASYVYNEIPSTCWGSAEKVTAWRTKHIERRQFEGNAAFAAQFQESEELNEEARQRRGDL